jgi:hypothetical protein
MTLYRWMWGPGKIGRLPGRKWELCRVLVRGKRNSILVEFLQDGFKAVTSRYAVRKVRDGD